MNLQAKRITAIVVSIVVFVVFIALDVVAAIYGDMLTDMLRPDPDLSGAQEVLEASDKLCRNLAEDSIVLLRNENNALPLKSDELKVNLFGVSAYDPSNAAAFDGFLMKGVGSGSSTISASKAITLEKSLELSGIEYNQDLKNFYDGFTFNRGSGGGNGSGGAYLLSEPAITDVQNQIHGAMSYSDVAIVVFSRLGGENIGEQPKTQAGNANKTYLEISDAEEELLKTVKNNFGKVIVLLNTSNVMHCGFLEEYKVDAAMYVGLTGQSGAVAIGELLKGETLDGDPLSPSGKLSDTYIYNTEFDPGFANAESSSRNGTHIQYSEDIYVGYRWYETAAAEGYLEYDKVVQYPFGYGLSYTTFEWELKDVSLKSGSEITNSNKNDTITVTVNVTNTGDVAGKDVVELYYTPPYYKGEIEKTEVNLLDFAKTSVLQPGEVEELKLTFTAYEMASFDAYDKNNNGLATYELDKGEYVVSLRTDSHTLATCENAEIKYSVNNNTGVIFDKDPVTGTDVVTRYTGEDAYAGVPIDGSTAGISQSFMSRADFAGTFPKTKAAAPTNGSEVEKAENYFYPGYDSETMPEQGKGGDLRITANGEFDYELIADLAKEYDSDLWDQLLDQMSVADLLNIVHKGGFGTPAISSVGKPEVNDFDGPAGFNRNSVKGNWSGSANAEETWTAYPCECLIGCSWNKTLLLQMGLSMGSEAAATSISGWYAPGINLHRTNYTSRNYEYYSEDPVLSGNLAANVILGAKYNGLYCYMKHFVVSESGPNGREWNTWVTEQALRELYLKPFEIAVKEGGANAVMSSFNRLGASWTGANHALLTEILRDEWGFKGSVVTDWSNGGGVGGMNPRQGVRAGNDTWLNPGTISGGLSSSDAVDVYCARNAAHNVLYTYVDTINFNHTADKSELDAALTVNKGVAEKGDFFPWWIPVFVVVEVLAFAGCGFWVFSTFKKKEK